MAQTPPDKPPSKAQIARERRLAEALRANLKRRKEPQTPKDRQGES